MIRYDRRGSGPPLVLIHGIAHRRQAWEPVFEQLAEHHDVIAIDLPGFGESPPPFPPTIEAAATSLRAFFDELGLGRPHVAGNSLGGALTLELAASGKIASATALSPAGFATTWERRRALLSLISARSTTFAPGGVVAAVLRSRRGRAIALRDIVADPLALSPDRALGDALAMRNGKGFAAAARALRHYTLEADIPADVPVTVAWGSLDRLLPPYQAVRAKERLPRARHVALPGCGHVPMSDNPALVASVILTSTGAFTPSG
jgi:pimeloyl-ACP methyl ester carboxylesterase